MNPATITALLIGSLVVGIGTLLAVLVNRVYRRVDDMVGAIGMLAAQANSSARRERRLIQLLEDLRAGRGEDADIDRTFDAAEEQKVAYVRLAERRDSPASQSLAADVRKTAIALYQQLIDRHPDAPQAAVARDRIQELSGGGPAPDA